MMSPFRRLSQVLLLLLILYVALSRAQPPVCPQQGATIITQLELVPRPKGIARLRCDFNIPPNPTHPYTGFLHLAWVIDTTSPLYTHSYDSNNVNNDGDIQPGYEDLVLSVTDDFRNLGQAPGSSIITLDVSLNIKNEFKCEVTLKNHQYCADYTTIQFQEPDITLEADGEVYCRNNGSTCGEIPSNDHTITCRVKNSESNPPTMTLTVNGEIISSGPPDVIINSDRYYDGEISASFNVPENANSTCTVMDGRGTYRITSQPDPCYPEPCDSGICRATMNDTMYICDCPLTSTGGDTCEAANDTTNGAATQHTMSEAKHMMLLEILIMTLIIWNTLKMETMITLF